MGFKPRTDAAKHAVTDGETMASVATAEGLTEDQLCLFNFGTTEQNEVNRALVEIVGCQKETPDGKSYEFTSQDSTRGSGEILIPKKFVKEKLAAGKTYVAVLKPFRPMCAVDITHLDKWFLPGEAPDGGEICDIKYQLEGVEKTATKVAFEVYGSNYCNVEQNADYELDFKPLGGIIPVYSEALADEKAKPRTAHAVDNWQGESNATDGMLKPAPPAKRFINVAFSPYTALIRYFEKDDDKNARILIEDFWPQFDAAKKAVPGSLEIKWKIEEASNLQHGQLIIVDKTDQVVFRKGLASGDVSNGDHNFTWDGKLKDGTDLKPEQMPYRVQIHAHTGLDEKQGLALAAMHTEVRLFVHQDTGKHPNEPFKDPNSLELALAPITTSVPAAASEEKKFYQYQLAKAGYHPGPVDGDLTRDDCRIAIEEFQRSVTVGAAPAFSRMAITGSNNAATTTALSSLPANARPLFGNPTNRADITADGTINGRLANAGHADGLLVWVEDRHYYTESAAGAGLPAHFDQGNYRPSFNCGDTRVDYDEDSIARPWLPVAVGFPLLGKDGAKKGVEATNKLVNDASREAVGPLRIDWKFEELPPELASIDQTHANYDKTRVRTHAWVRDVIDSQKGSHGGRDYTNCPETLGGVRPAALADYYKALFGFDDDSLLPWVTYDDGAAKGICGLVHDDYGQAADHLHADHRGRVGTYFRPSRIAGDGYRVGAKLGFEEVADAPSSFPNREVLARRYPLSPQAYTCPLRVWRKTSYRGYLYWCRVALKKWASHHGPAAELYRPACLHFVEEAPLTGGGTLDAAAPGLVTATYNNIITSQISDAHYLSQPITLNPDYVWPFLTAKRWGLPVSAPGTTIASFRSKVLTPMWNATWRRFRKRLIWELVAAMEQQHGLMKGHLIVQFSGSPTADVWEYKCRACNKTFVELIENLTPAERLDQQPCPACGASGSKKRPEKTADTRSSLALAAVGCGMGATWVFTSGGPEVWTHEVGHHRHLQHAQSWPGQTTPAPGAVNTQHDARPNTFKFGAGASGKEQCWDQRCIMSYSHGAQYFCGRCALKMRGWRVETGALADPAGGVHD